MDISAKDVMSLREKTGAGMMECKKALAECGGDTEKAVDFLRKKGVAAAQKRSGRETKSGMIAVYVHPGSQVATMVEVNCETDFVARNEKFQEFCKNIAMHITASNPLAISEDELPADAVAREREIYRDQALNEGKKADFVDKIVDGRMKKYFAENCLLQQVYVKDENHKMTVQELLTNLIAVIGENITISRFVKYEVGGK